MLALLGAGGGMARANCVASLSPKDLVAPGELQLSINPTNPPQQYVNSSGALKGLNVELAEEIGKRLCLPVKLVRMDFPGMIPALKAGRLDGMDTGMFWSEARAKILFMVPYGVQALSLVERVDGPVRIHRADDLSGTSVAVETNSYQQKWLTDSNAAAVARGAKPIAILAFPNATDAAGALLAGQVQSALLIDSVARSLVAKGRVREVVTGLGENRMAMAFRTRPVADAFVRAFKAMQADGTYRGLFDKFGLTPLPDGQAVAIVGPGPQ